MFLIEANHNQLVLGPCLAPVLFVFLTAGRDFFSLPGSIQIALPHFAACGIPKNTPHGTMEGHTAYIYMLSVYPIWMELFSFSLYTNYTHFCTA